MSLMTRLQLQFQKVSRIVPAFQPISRSLDIRDKGKAEENVYFKKQQDRLLDKLRRMFQMEPKADTDKATEPKPSTASNDEKNQK